VNYLSTILKHDLVMLFVNAVMSYKYHRKILIVNPLAVWEIKEYYGSTTFGSRIADGVYETMLDGEEFTELREHEEIDIKHYLIVDDYHTWWDQGKSYLCRMVDMVHMGLVDEILFGREVIVRSFLLVSENVAA